MLFYTVKLILKINLIADIIKLKFLKWGYYPALSRWALNTITCSRGTQREILHTQRKGEVKTKQRDI